MKKIFIILLFIVSSCNAEIDQSATIQEQIDLHALQQIPYSLPIGRIHIYSPLIIRTNSIIKGTGPTFSTVIHPHGVSAFIIDGDNVNGGWAFRNELKGFTIDGSDAVVSELIVIHKAYSSKIKRVFIYNQIAFIGIDVSDSNHIQLNELVLYGESQANKFGIVISGKSTVTINDVDIENYSRCLKISGNAKVDLNSPYMERCIVNIEHATVGRGRLKVHGGYLNSINGYNIGIFGNNLKIDGTSLESYTGSETEPSGKIMHCFNTSYINVEFNSIPRYNGFLQNTNCPGGLI